MHGGGFPKRHTGELFSFGLLGDEEVRRLGPGDEPLIKMRRAKNALTRLINTVTPVAFGSTLTGRFIAVIFQEIDEDTARPVTAYDIEE